MLGLLDLQLQHPGQGLCLPRFTTVIIEERSLEIGFVIGVVIRAFEVVLQGRIIEELVQALVKRGGAA